MEGELKFPVTAHHRIIVYAERYDLAATRRLFEGFDLVEPVSESRASGGGRYVSIGVSVRFADKTEMVRFDECIKNTPGLKMVL